MLKDWLKGKAVCFKCTRVWETRPHDPEQARCTGYGEGKIVRVNYVSGNIKDATFGMTISNNNTVETITFPGTEDEDFAPFPLAKLINKDGICERFDPSP